MDILPVTKKYKNHRFPVEIISHAVWLYFRFCLSFRDVEEILLERGVVVTYEAQLNAASSLNLLLAAIVVWNIVHLQACLRRLQAEEYPVDDADLPFLSPLVRRHLGLYGQYTFDVHRSGSPA